VIAVCGGTEVAVDDQLKTGFWIRVVADSRFRDAVIADPLRAVAEVDDVDATAGQVRQLEGMDAGERREFVAHVVRAAYMKGTVARWGPLDEQNPGVWEPSGPQDTPDLDEG